MSNNNQHIKNELELWEKQLTGMQRSDVTLLYDEWIRIKMGRIHSSTKNKFFAGLDNIFFHTHALLLGTKFHKEARDSVVTMSRIFNNDIRNIEDIKQLTIEEKTYLAQQQIAKIKFSSMVQGGVTGTGGVLLLGVDFPLLIITNLRIVQLISLSFGHEVNHPYEMMLALKVFHAASLPKRFQAGAWDDLMNELLREPGYMYKGQEEITDHTWLDVPIKQAVKTVFIRTARRKLIQGVPLLGIGIGAFTNYQFTRDVAAFAIRFYQKRYYMSWS